MRENGRILEPRSHYYFKFSARVGELEPLRRVINSQMVVILLLRDSFTISLFRQVMNRDSINVSFSVLEFQR